MEEKKIDRTQLVFIIDRSGSMSGLERDTVGGYNRVLEENKKLEGECLVTTVLFDTSFQFLYEGVPVAQVPAMQLSDYRPGGCTALLDAMGECINRMVWQKDPGRVQFIILTDGEENSSHKYDVTQIREMVTRVNKERGWEFLYLGANIDAISAARQIGIREDCAVEAISDSTGTAAQYEAIACANLSYRACASMPMTADWKEAVEADRKRRGKK